MTRLISPAPHAFALLDRDGTIIIDRCYLDDPDGIEFTLGALEGMKLLRDAGFNLVLITNQSGIARGYFDEATLHLIHDRLEMMLAAEGLALTAIEYCPHGPYDGCACRKPKPGMINAAMAKLGFNSDCAVMIGDSDADMGAAEAAGVLGIRIRPDGADGAATNFLEAAKHALGCYVKRNLSERLYKIDRRTEIVGATRR